jgi:transcription elongation factor GreA
MAGPDGTRATIPLTTAGRQRLRDEIARTEIHLAELRAAAADVLHDRAGGRDDPTASAARLAEQERAEARVASLRETLGRAVDAGSGAGQTALLGTAVRVRDADGEEMTYTLVAPAEADPLAGRVSVASPVGRALQGRRPGEVATVDAPDGPWQLRVVALGPAGAPGSEHRRA